MKILNDDLFKRELEWLEDLKKAEGPYNERIISFCDRWHLANGSEFNKIKDPLLNFITNVFKDFSLDLEEIDKKSITDYFSKEKPNYYSIKKFIIDTIGKIVDNKG